MADDVNPLPSYFCYGNQAFYPLHTEFSYPFEPKLEPETDVKSRLRNATLPERHARYTAEVEAEPQRKIYNANLGRQYVQMGGVQDVFGRWTFPMAGAVGRQTGGVFSLGHIDLAPMRIRWRDGPLGDKMSVPWGGRRSGVVPWHKEFGVPGSGLEAEDSGEIDEDENRYYDLLEDIERQVGVAETAVQGTEEIDPENVDENTLETATLETPVDQDVADQDKTLTQATLNVPKPLWTTVLRTVSGEQTPPSPAVVTWAIPTEASNFQKMRAAEAESTSRYIADPTSYSHSLHVEGLDDSQNCALWITNLKKNVTAVKLFQVIKEGPVFILHICSPNDKHFTAAAKLVFMTPGAAAAFRARTVAGEIKIDGMAVKAVYNRTGYRENKKPERTRVLIIRGAKEHMHRDRWLKYFGSCARYELEADFVHVDDHDENMMTMEFRFTRVETQSEMIYRALVREKKFGDIFSFGFGPDPCDKSG